MTAPDPPRRAAAVELPRSLAEPAPVARLRRRHRRVLWSGLLCVLLPALGIAAYLYLRAADQYAARLGFTVRVEEPAGADLLGALPGLSSGIASDADILYEFLLSQDIVRRLDARLDLRHRFGTVHGRDPVFALAPGAPIEALTRYWGRMVRVYHDPGSRLIEVQARAFTPEDAEAIAAAVFEESARMINAINAQARSDATRFARAELARAEAELREARAALTAFRRANRMVDPEADLRGRMGLLNTLEAQLAGALIDLDLLRETTRSGDPRIAQSERRIAVIQTRIAAERAQLGVGGSDGHPDRQRGPGAPRSYSDLLAEYERLTLDREFSEEAYLAARAALDAAQAAAERQTRYLAAYITPTRPETAEYPQRGFLSVGAVLFLGLVWATGVLAALGFRDRR